MNGRQEIFEAQTQNVRALNRAWKKLNITLNNAIRKSDSHAIRIHTKVLVLVFCAWAEASFSKLIHTPYGFSNDEITQIKDEQKKAAWKQGGKDALNLL